MPEPVLIALGANLGDPIHQLRLAVRRLRGVVDVHALSPVYLTEPIGFTEQPDFFNLACRGWADLPVLELHESLQAIETELGRERHIPNGPRHMDIDLLAYGEIVLETPDLIVPHPRLHERAFVLVPLAEIAPDWRHPVLDSTPAQLLAALERPGRVRRWGRIE